VLAQQGTQAVQFLVQLGALLGEDRQAGVRGLPVLLECLLLGDQVVFLVTQRGGLFVFLSAGSGGLLAANPLDLAVQLARLGSGAHALLDGR
jgi:hypothetical protein